MPQAFTSHNRIPRTAHVRCARAQQAAEDGRQPRQAIKTLTAVLAAGAVLLPHGAIAVSGGGGEEAVCKRKHEVLFFAM